MNNSTSGLANGAGGTDAGANRAILVTFDTDWAPDWILQDVADILLRSRVRATWFITNDGPATRALLREPLFEVGLHPNFLPGSSHGSSPEDVMAHLKSIAPEAVSVRSHSLCQSEPLLKIMVERFGIAHDCSIHLPLQAGVTPHVIRLGADTPPLVRLPHVFQDNMYMFEKRPWSLGQPWFTSPGLKIFCFHPIHVVMNACSMTDYEQVKSKRSVSRLRRSDVPNRPLGEGGCMDLLLQLLNYIQTARTYTVHGYASDWLRSAKSEVGGSVTS
jgi:hypothetical protein